MRPRKQGEETERAALGGLVRADEARLSRLYDGDARIGLPRPSGRSRARRESSCRRVEAMMWTE